MRAVAIVGRLLAACVTIGACMSWAGPLAAQEGDEAAEARVVQKRRHVPSHEIFAAAGWLPLDAFEKGLTASGGYALHFDEAIALEVSFTQSFPYDTALREELLAEDVEPTPYEVVKQFVAGAWTWTPLYGKLAVGSSGLVHMDLSFSAGGGYGWFSVSSRPLALWGSTLRFYLSRILSARLDVRALHFIQADSLFAGWDLHTDVSMALGLALSLGG